MPGMVPKCDNKHPEWPIAILNMHNWYMVCKTVARQPQDKHFSVTKRAKQQAYIGLSKNAKMAP